MGTFAFCEILCSALKQSRFRLVNEFSQSFRSSISCRTFTCNFKKQLPAIRYPFTSKWYSSILICSCQTNNIITMPKCKVEDKSDSKLKKKSASNINVKSNSLKQIKKKKKKKKHHHHHKKKQTKRHSSKSKLKKPELILLDSSSNNDSDVCILYDSRIKDKTDKSRCTISSCLINNRTNKSEVCAKLETSKNTIEVEVEITNKCVENGPLKSNHLLLHEVFEQCTSVKRTSESECVSKGVQDFDSTSASIQSGDGPSTILRSDQDVSGPSSGPPVNERTSDQKFRQKWEFTNFAETMANKTKDQSCDENSYIIFDVLSYNVLCQEIMEEHMDLYIHHNPSALDWDYRSKLLMKEFVEFGADVMCLQEVQESHLMSFYSELQKMGYIGLFKQRTGDKKDGVAIYFKNSTFQLIDYTSVEYYQPGISVLNRDNVGLIVKLAPKLKPDERIIVATTHLLYNPRRHDVKLAQVQILLAEVERFAFKEIDERTKETKYWPVILTGDMNFEPNTGGFQLLNMGWFRYDGLSSRTLTTEYYGYGRILGKELIPPYLGVTDSCQHWSLIMQRSLQSTVEVIVKSNDDHKEEIKLLQIYNSDFKKHTASSPRNLESVERKNLLEKLSKSQEGFGSGQLNHTLQLESVYQHDPQECFTGSQVSTYQNGWVVVDHMFYSNDWNSSVGTKEEGNLKLVARYKLLSADQATAQGPIPNLSSPSDHYPLAAKFALLF